METIYETIYRPPTEHKSALLELSVGCSWGRCTFCRLANGAIPLQAAARETLEANLLEMACAGETPHRMFLTGENALAFKTSYLLETFGLVRRFLPSVREFAVFGRADDVLSKTPEQLDALQKAGLATVYVGVESGNAAILRRVRKGAGPKQTTASLKRLDEAGIAYGLSAIMGLGGPEMWEDHARDTAALFNGVNPASIRLMTLTPMPGTPLAEEVEAGTFTLSSPLQILREERMLIGLLNPGKKGYRLVANHVSNQIPITGNLPQDREKLLDILDRALAAPARSAKSRDGAW